MSMSWTIPVTGRGSAGTSGQESVVIARFDSYRRAEHMLVSLGRGSAGRPAGAPCHGWSDSWACSPWREAQVAGSALSRCVAGTSGRRSTGPTRSWPELARMRPWCWLPARTRRRIRWSPRPRPTASARPAQVLLEYQGGLRRHCVIGCADHEQNPSAVRSGSSRVRGGPGRATAPRQRPCRPGQPRADCRPDDGAPSGLPLVGLHPDQGVDQVRCLPPPGTIPLDDQQRAAGRNLDRSLPAVLVPSRRPVTDRLAVVHRDKDPVNQQVGPAEAGMLPGDVSRCG
jgi:hypothetical protein